MSGNDYFDEHQGLKWCESAGMGFYPVTESPYDDAYFDKYVEMANTEMGVELTHARLAFVNKYAPTAPIVDIGVGSGQFMDAAGALGYDVNPTAVRMLIKKHAFLNPYSTFIKCATFWDSLEHIPDIDRILKHVTDYIFVSLPIFDDLDHVLRSKHFRPDEHCWYFTKSGFERFIAAHGFTVLEYSTIETEIGREGIGTFVCKREN